MASGFEILLNGPAFNIWERCEVLLNAVLQSKFACMAAVSFPTNPASCSTGSKTSKPDHHSAHTVQLQTVRLTLKWGQIEEEKVRIDVMLPQTHWFYWPLRWSYELVTLYGFTIFIHHIFFFFIILRQVWSLTWQTKTIGTMVKPPMPYLGKLAKGWQKKLRGPVLMKISS